jgi:hypothetical protein
MLMRVVKVKMKIMMKIMKMKILMMMMMMLANSLVPLLLPPVLFRKCVIINRVDSLKSLVNAGAVEFVCKSISHLCMPVCLKLHMSLPKQKLIVNKQFSFWLVSKK